MVIKYFCQILCESYMYIFELLTVDSQMPLPSTGSKLFFAWPIIDLQIVPIPTVDLNKILSHHVSVSHIGPKSPVFEIPESQANHKKKLCCASGRKL